MVKRSFVLITKHACKDVSIKNHTYYFFDDIINIKIFDLNSIKIVENPYKNILFNTFDMQQSTILNI